MTSQEGIQNESQNLKVTVLLFYNGTYVVNQSTDHVLEIVEIVLLGIVFLISFCTNIFLLVTIISSYTLRSESFNILLANFCLIFLIETSVNMSLALLYVAIDIWKLGSVGCCISSFMVQLVTMEITFGLCIGSVEGMILVRHPYDFQTFWTIKKQAVTIATFWVIGILLCLPLLLESIKSEMFPSRYGCSFIGTDGFVYMLFVTVWCYGFMIIITVGCLINLGIQQYKDYKAQVKKHGTNYSEVFMPGGLWTEWINVKLVAWLLLLFVLLELPFIIILQSTGLKSHTSSKSSIVDSSLKYETVLTWFRYLYSCLLPCIVFKIRKDIRYKFWALLHCCHPNVVRDHSAAPIVKQENKKKGNRKDSIPPINLNTPVLYISPEGLCLRQLAPPAKPFLNYSKNDKVNKVPNFISYICDVECSAVAEEYLKGLESFNSTSRRSSKESEMSLGEFANKDSFRNESQDIPLKDLDSRVLETPKPVEPLPQKKSVRFAETLTYYRVLTPKAETPTPDWVTNVSRPKDFSTGIRSRHSKIPMRIQPTTATSPWKVELNGTYSVKSPLEREVKNKYENDFNDKINNSSRKRHKGNSLDWVINE